MYLNELSCITRFNLQDIHFVARDHGEMALSEVARRKAEELYDEVHSTGKSLIHLPLIFC